MEFRRCYFDNCGLSVTCAPDLRSRVRNVTILDCSERACNVYGAVIEDTLIDGLRTSGKLFQTWAAVFNRVTLKGKIDRMMISSTAFPGVATAEQQQAFDEVNEVYYRHVEWALDISRGEFKEFSIRGLPGHLIRRDPETQMLVTRERALRGGWKGLEFRENLWPVSLDLFLQREDPSIVLVAPKRHTKFRNYLEDLHLLRQAGVTEPD